VETRKQSEEALDWAYEVLNNVSAAMDKAATSKVLTRKLFGEISEKFEDILTAFLVVVPPEHREIVVRIVKSYMNWQGTWFK